VLHAAALDGRTDLVKCLLDHGAEPVRHNSQFETPRTWPNAPATPPSPTCSARPKTANTCAPPPVPSAPPPPAKTAKTTKPAPRPSRAASPPRTAKRSARKAPPSARPPPTETQRLQLRQAELRSGRHDLPRQQVVTGRHPARSILAG
jgi:hypothetical protein